MNPRRKIYIVTDPISILSHEWIERANSANPQPSFTLASLRRMISKDEFLNALKQGPIKYATSLINAANICADYPHDKNINDNEFARPILLSVCPIFECEILPHSNSGKIIWEVDRITSAYLIIETDYDHDNNNALSLSACAKLTTLNNTRFAYDLVNKDHQLDGGMFHVIGGKNNTMICEHHINLTIKDLKLNFPPFSVDSMQLCQTSQDALNNFGKLNKSLAFSNALTFFAAANLDKNCNMYHLPQDIKNKILRHYFDELFETNTPNDLEQIGRMSVRNN